MQIFWVSGPVGNIKRLNLSKINLMLFVVFMTTLLILLGATLQFLGFRMAIEYNPALARQLGNVHTAVELENLNSFYKSRLNTIESRLEENNKKITELTQLNAKLKDFATPPTIAIDKSKNASAGGPYLPTKRSPPGGNSVFDSLDWTHKNLDAQNQNLVDSLSYWQKQITWLSGKPLSYPIQHNVSLSSLFGNRLDPIKGVSSLHQGLDFQGSIGAPITSSADGIVEKAGWDPQYGNEVIINHGDGYMTRYAHASELLVKPGDRVSRLQTIAKIGQSGRSTGPHLHFEILKNGKVVDPQTYLIGSRKVN